MSPSNRNLFLNDGCFPFRDSCCSHATDCGPTNIACSFHAYCALVFTVTLETSSLIFAQVIQAVKTYKSLVGFVSTTVLSRLITKKIWTNPPLWEGFMRCAKIIAPASFGALLQLPREQLRELVDKQPSLKAGLRDYVTKKAPNKARGAGLLDIFGEPDDKSGAGTPQPTSENLAAVLS